MGALKPGFPQELDPDDPLLQGAVRLATLHTCVMVDVEVGLRPIDPDSEHAHKHVVRGVYHVPNCTCPDPTTRAELVSVSRMR